MILAIVLMLVGFGFVLAEVFFVSFGLLSLIAGVLMLFADVLAFEEGQVVGWTFIGAQVVLIPLIVHGAFRVLPRLPFGRRMLLDGPVTPPGAGVPDLRTLLGRRGVALTDLRPAGTARFDDERVSVVSLGGLVPRDAAIVVVGVEGAEVRVRALDESPPEGDR